ncbi:hypothetical protein [Methylobacterium nodulans]|uniref:Uncharacterized protein n=1 Tax=Methylobacterium nodulans (strain LMG 21967 / CNCM I-2342 / ORS 2060) TaxID=460265 RepID=B8ILH1_METNO|nr:hypothetical protein [Methylobacterium nodulans]ACL60170.1 conserved hypothetical protein [Methylobacterium nodulans ORS 2060]
MGEVYDWRRIGRPVFMEPPFDGQPVELRLASGAVIEARLDDPELVVTEDPAFTLGAVAWRDRGGHRLPEGDPPVGWRPLAP